MLLPEGVFLSLGCLAIALVLMIFCWILAVRSGNAGIVDLFWSAGFMLLSFFVFAFASGYFWRKLAFASIVSIWSARLTFHLVSRFLRHWPEEDPRYTKLKNDCRGNLNFMLFYVFLWQGLIMALMILPVIAASCDSSGSLRLVECLGLALSLLSLLAESVADRQLTKFKSESGGSETVCRSGLWKYSRHPNYFFEWLFWLGVFIAASFSPGALYCAFVPLMYLHLLLNVTGVKPAEEHSLKVRGEAYRVYQEETSAFFPCFKRTRK